MGVVAGGQALLDRREIQRAHRSPLAARPRAPVKLPLRPISAQTEGSGWIEWDRGQSAAIRRKRTLYQFAAGGCAEFMTYLGKLLQPRKKAVVQYSAALFELKGSVTFKTTWSGISGHSLPRGPSTAGPGHRSPCSQCSWVDLPAVRRPLARRRRRDRGESKNPPPLR